MIKAISLFFASLFYVNQLSGQDTLPCSMRDKLPVAENVHPYIKGKKGKKKIQWKYFYKGFELLLSDESYRIVSFHLTWDVIRLNNSMIVSRNNTGSFVSKDLPDSMQVNDKSVFSLTTIPPGSLIAIDSILASKDGVCYRIPSVVFYTVLKKKEEV